ncbi:hypothetical protein DB347_00085 [Opitutaceae bacterium EW11]|nr:hypothetical protein DB347_00085 [Opitutaceae bacterium EW11]
MDVFAHPFVRVKAAVQFDSSRPSRPVAMSVHSLHKRSDMRVFRGGGGVHRGAQAAGLIFDM